MTRYRRTIITGTLTTKTNLHIGSGEEKARNQEKVSDKPDSLVNVIVCNQEGRAYIPASSLRGFLGNQIKDEVLHQAIFGLARQPSESKKAGNIGHLRLYDAHIQGIVQPTQQISRTRIDPVTLAAKEHHLSTHEVIPPETHFNLTLELDHSTEEEIKALLQALAALNNTPGGQLGKGKSIGQGRLQWDRTDILGLTDESLKKWLEPPKEAAKAKKRKRGKPAEGGKCFSSDPNFMAEYFEPLEITTGPVTSPWKTIAFTLKPQSPILINEPQRVEQLKQESKNRAAEREARGDEPPLKKETIADAIHMLHRGQACIPGATLKGWLRAHCRRILLTILGGAEEEREQRVAQMLAQLFGSAEHGRGILLFDDALADIDPEKHLHPQTFIALDRFTGGAKPSALYNVEAVWPETFDGSLHYRRKKLRGWMKILLLYALRDAMEGDLVLGWGKSRGYGRLRLEPSGIALNIYSKEQLAVWRQALQVRLQQEEAA